MSKKFMFDCDKDTKGNYLCFDPDEQVCSLWDNCKCRNVRCRSPSDDQKWPDPNDEEWYYQCDNERVKHVQCSSGTVFDPASLECRAKNNDCSVPGKRYRHKCYCDLYYECKGGELTLKKCADGWLFDEVALKCLPAKDARCSGKVPGNDCPSTGKIEFPDPESCYRYYLCVDGVKTLRPCPPATVFDEVKLMCVWWADGVCNKKDFTTPPSSAGECLNWPKRRRSNPDDCNKFYECVDGEVMERKCLENHYFNERLQACDRKKTGNCKKQSTKDPDCAGVICGTKRFKHEKCEWYYECQNGVKEVKQCPSGLQYNKYTEMCDAPEKVNCYDCKVGTRTPHECQCDQYYECNNEQHFILKSCPAGKNFDLVTLECLPQEKAKCHKRNFVAVIALSDAATCPANIPDGTIKYIPHDTDCHKYYECKAGGSRKEGTCPFNRENIQFCFDKVNEICAAPSDAPGCCDGQDPDPDDCPCSTAAKCVMHYDDENVEICVKKKTPSSSSSYLKWLKLGCNVGTMKREYLIDNVDFCRINTVLHNLYMSIFAKINSHVLKPGQIRYIPHDANCYKYYKCSIKGKEEETCPLDDNRQKQCFNGMYCDTQGVGRCVPPCEKNPPTVPTTTSTISTAIPAGTCPVLKPGQIRYIPHDANCYKYYKCSIKGKEEETCPLDDNRQKQCFNGMYCDTQAIGRCVPPCENNLPTTVSPTDTTVTTTETTMSTTGLPPTPAEVNIVHNRIDNNTSRVNIVHNKIDNNISRVNIVHNKIDNNIVPNKIDNKIDNNILPNKIDNKIDNNIVHNRIDNNTSRVNNVHNRIDNNISRVNIVHNKIDNNIVPNKIDNNIVVLAYIVSRILAEARSSFAMKRMCILAVIATVVALSEAKEILRECPMEWNDGETIHIPHETNPHWFYKCFLGKKYLFKCPQNRDPPFELCYNPELQVCDWPWNVTNCGYGPTPTPTPTWPTPTPTWPTPPPTWNTPLPTWPTPTPTKPTPTPTWPTPTPTKPTPTPTWPTPTPTKPTPTPTWPTPTPTRPTPSPGCSRLPNQNNCKMYYDLDGRTYCCLENQVYNPKLCACDRPSNVPSCNPIPACELS
ncbi:uncharacterized protein LOC144467579 [Augochlora pura]